MNETFTIDDNFYTALDPLKLLTDFDGYVYEPSCSYSGDWSFTLSTVPDYNEIDSEMFQIIQ